MFTSVHIMTCWMVVCICTCWTNITNTLVRQIVKLQVLHVRICALICLSINGITQHLMKICNKFLNPL